jgi:hypothetical protein
MGLDLLPPGGTRVLEIGVGSGVLIGTRYRRPHSTPSSASPCSSTSGTSTQPPARSPAPGGTLVTGYPMLNRLMTRAFDAIGFRGIDDHHVSPPRRIAAALAGVLSPVARAAFPPHAPVGAALYQCTSWSL